RRMWSHVTDGAPIVSITNGVDHRVWQDQRIAHAQDDASLYEAHQACKRELIAEIEGATGVGFAEDRLLIGFARRATAYKRPTLLFHDPARAERLMADGRMQILYAGKSHPRDVSGRKLISELVAISRRHPGSVAFLPDYDLRLGRLLTRGVDVWLNT